MMRPSWSAIRFALGASALLLGAGCGPRQFGPPPTSEIEALGRINGNFGRIDRPVYAKGLVRVWSKDEQGRDHDSLDRDFGLLFIAPQSLRIDVTALSGKVAQFGSNPRRYWAWIDDSNKRTLWWGDWERLSAKTNPRLIIPPDQLLNALMLRPLPQSRIYFLRVDREQGDYRLFFVRQAGDGSAMSILELRLDDHEPWLPVEVIERLPNGLVLMHAQLSDYQPLSPNGPLTARNYVISWPARGTRMDLRIKETALYGDKVRENYFDAPDPATWEGPVEALDESRRGAPAGDQVQ